MPTATALEIKETISSITKLESAKKYFEVLTNSLESMRAELSEKSIQLSKEQDDIELLEKMSITSIFHKVMGNKEELLEKERQDYLALALKIKELKKSIELSEFEAAIVKEKAAASDLLLQKLEGLKVQRLNEIVNYNESSKSDIINVLHDIDKSNRINVELREAYAVGEEALQHVQMTLQKLQEAIKYGEWDMMGQNMASYSKHASLDEAIRSAYNAQRILQLYNRELLDVGISDSLLNIQVESFGSFTDIFIDNLITDWIIQKKIKNTFMQIKAVSEKIALIQMSMTQRITNLSQQLKDLEIMRDKIILEA